MRVFNVSSGDEIGGRWNGFDAIEPLSQLGVDSRIGSFWNKTSTHGSSVNLFPNPYIRPVAEAVRALEVLTGRQATFQFWSKGIFDLDEFKKADVIHLQVIHDHLLSLGVMTEISKRKPTVWTWHDFWPLTGHCISPGACHRWAKGCGHCPSLDAPLEVVWDRTKQERARKKKAFSSAGLNVHVSTNWMQNQISEKASDWELRIFQFPFGIDTSLFSPKDKTRAKAMLGISEGTFVVAARATEDPNKGFANLVMALEKVVKSGREVLLLTVQQQHLVGGLSKVVPSVELPWTNDPKNLARFYQAADLFVMPSLVETFGMMTLESMACGVPVITVEGTAPSEVSGCQILEVKKAFLSESLAEKISYAVDNRTSIVQLGLAARHRAVEKYPLASYVANLKLMYSDVLESHRIV